MAAAAASGGFSLLSAPPASAFADASQRFDLAGNGGDYFVQAALHQPYWAMQSFAFDHVNEHIYAVQSKPGSSTGDLWVTRTDLTGTVLGAMAIHAFDHGSSMGVQPDTYGSPYVWIAGDWGTLAPDTAPNSHTLCRFKYHDGGDLDYADPSVEVFPVAVADFVDCPRPAIDPCNNTLLVRYMGTTTPWRLALFDLDAVLDHGISNETPRITERELPSNAELGLTDADLFQGVAVYGQYAYLLYGGPPAHPTDPAEPSYLVSVDLNSTGGQYTERFRTLAGNNVLPGREPQGMAVHRSPTGPRLAFGFSSKISVDPDEFRATIFYKSDLVN